MRRARPGSLRTQLIVGNIVSLVALLTGLGLIVRFAATSALLRSVDRAMERQIGRMPPGGPMPGGPGGFGGGMGRPPRGPGGPDDDLTLMPRHFDREGHPLGFRELLSHESFVVAAREGVRDTRRIVLHGEPTRILSVPFLSQGRIEGVGQVGYRLTEIEDAVAWMDRTLLLLLPAGILSAAAGGILLTNRVLRRIHAVAVAAQDLAGRPDAVPARLPVQGNDEFSELATVLNTLLARQEEALRERERALEQERRFTGDASHELQSPLTVIKGVTTIALDRAAAATPEQSRQRFAQVDRAADTMIALVQDLLLLARSDSQQLGQDPIDILLSEILERALELYVPDGAPVEIHLASPDLLVRGNESELLRLFANLLRNARQYTPPEGQVWVRATRERAGVLIAIQDTGIGIAPEHLSRLGERFYRVDGARARRRGGTGLGLSICQGIVAAHGGRIDFASEIGKGTTALVWLP